MSPYYAAAVQNLSPFSSLYANHDLGKEGKLQFKLTFLEANNLETEK